MNHLLALQRDLQRSILAAERDRVLADPVAHKKTRLFDKGMGYRYYDAGRDGRGRPVRFCYSSKRNIAGYFLGWREVLSPASKVDLARGTIAGGKRDQWLASKTRRIVKEYARRRSMAFRAKRARPPLDIAET